MDLYDNFIMNWFDIEENKEIGRVNGRGVENIVDRFYNFSKRLASKMTSQNKTVVLYDSLQKNHEYKEFFDTSNEELNTIRRGIPLQVSRSNKITSYSFMHKTILEYFAALAGRN
jgi:hypothetical protein